MTLPLTDAWVVHIVRVKLIVRFGSIIIRIIEKASIFLPSLTANGNIHFSLHTWEFHLIDKSVSLAGSYDIGSARHSPTFLWCIIVLSFWAFYEVVACYSVFYPVVNEEVVFLKQFWIKHLSHDSQRRVDTLHLSIEILCSHEMQSMTK